MNEKKIKELDFLMEILAKISKLNLAMSKSDIDLYTTGLDELLKIINERIKEITK